MMVMLGKDTSGSGGGDEGGVGGEGGGDCGRLGGVGGVGDWRRGGGDRFLIQVIILER